MTSTTNQEDTFVPFTTAERMQQLGAIDRDIAKLLQSAGNAIKALGKKEAEDGNAAAAATAAAADANPVNVFQESMNDFIRGLRRVNVGMKRQILGLEEAGIISLRKDEGAAADSQGASSTHQPRLEPDGEGKIGGLDVGWLNSRNNQIEQQMAAELWGETEKFLQDLVNKQQNLKLKSGADTSGK